MKKIGKLLFILLLCFGFVGCSNNKSVSNITEKFKEKNYNVSYNSGDEPTITISESKEGLVKSIGVCNFEKSQLEFLLNNCEIVPMIN